MNTKRIIRPLQVLPALGALIATTVIGGSAIGANDAANASTVEDTTSVEIGMVPQVTVAHNIEFVSQPVEQPLPVEPEPEVLAASGVHSEADILCLAKIIHHESANQPEHVQLAVASVVLNRVESGRFAPTICGVALQPKQFFNVHAYRPFGDPRWETSQRLAREAVQGKGRDHAPGALFFRSAGYQSSFFRSRPHIARLGDLDFHK